MTLLTLHIPPGVRNVGTGVYKGPDQMSTHRGVVVATRLVKISHQRRAPRPGPGRLANGAGAVALLQLACAAECRVIVWHGDVAGKRSKLRRAVRHAAGGGQGIRTRGICCPRRVGRCDVALTQSLVDANVIIVTPI